MADTKDIQLNITANTSQAETALRNLKGATEGAAGAIERKAVAAANGNAAMVSFGRIIQDAPFGIIGVANNITMLSEQFVALKAQAGSTGAALQAMKAALYGPMGLTIVISAATTALQFFSLASQGAKKAVNEVEAALKKVLDLKNPLEGYKKNMGIVELRNMLFSEKNILKTNEAELAKLKRAGYGLGAVDFYASQSGAKTSDGDAIRAIQDRIKKLETENEASQIFIKTVEGEIKAYEKLEASAKVLDRYFRRGNEDKPTEDDKGLPSLKELKDKKEKIATFLETFRDETKLTLEIDDLLNKKTPRTTYADFIKTIDDQIKADGITKTDLLEWLRLRREVLKAMDEDYANIDVGAEFSSVFSSIRKNAGKLYKAGLSNQKQEERDRLKQMKDEAKKQYDIYKDFFIDPFTNAFRGEFSKAWNSIFGEANSLLEKFIQNLGEQLFNLGVQKLATGIMNMILPGSGEIIGAASGGGSNKAINLFIGNELVATEKTAMINKAIIDRTAALR